MPCSSSCPQRNKAKICTFFVRGECKRGAECPYRHEMPTSGAWLILAFLLGIWLQPRRCWHDRDVPRVWCLWPRVHVYGGAAFMAGGSWPACLSQCCVASTQ